MTSVANKDRYRVHDIDRENFIDGFRFIWKMLGKNFVYTYSKSNHFKGSHGYLSVNDQSDVVSIEFKQDGFRAFAMKGGFLLETQIKFSELIPVE